MSSTTHSNAATQLGALQGASNTQTSITTASPNAAGNQALASQDSSTDAKSKLYAATVRAYSQRLPDRYLSTGAHFWHLAEFLDPLPSKITRRSSPRLEQRWPFLVSSHWSPDKSVETLEYDSITGPQDFLARNSALKSGNAQLLFLRGFPSREWLNFLGSYYSVDPEYFRRHLAFMDSKDLHDLPALPSASRSLFQLKVTTIFAREVPISLDEVERSRKEEMDLVQNHQRQMGDIIGESIVRRYSVHNETTFSVEQHISCYVGLKNDGWFGFVWLDSGLELKQTPRPSHTHYLAPTQPLRDMALPTIQHQTNAALVATLPEPQLAGVPSQSNRAFQNTIHLPNQYAALLDQDTVRADTMYGLSRLFTFAASNESQFLNYAATQIEDALRMSDTQEKLSLANLRYTKNLLDYHLTYLNETLIFVNRGGDPKWPRAWIDSPHHSTAKKVQRDIEDDFGCLALRAKALVTRCTDGMDIITNGASLEESRRAILSSEKIGKLTMLAFFFVPLTFICSLFGMNMRELGQGNLGIWAFFVLAVPTTVLSTIICFWDRMSWDSLRNYRWIV